MSPNNTLKVGFVGLSKTGWAAQAIAPALLQDSLKGKVDLVAVSTRSQESADESAATYGEKVGHPIKALFGSSATIASDPNVDIVAVSVTATHHKSLWPAGTSSAETDEIAAAARKAGVRTFVGLQTRHSRAVEKIQEVVKSGQIGKVLSVQMTFYAGREGNLWQPLVKAGTHYWKKSVGATATTIVLGHLLDAFTFAHGELKTVFAASTTQYPVVTFIDEAGVPTGETPPSQTYDHFSVIGELETGASYNILVRSGEKSVPSRKTFEWVIDGEDGTILLTATGPTGSFLNIFDPDVFVNGEKVDLGGPVVGGSYNIGNIWANFVDGKEGSYPTIDDAVRNHARLNAIEKSLSEGRVAKLL